MEKHILIETAIPQYLTLADCRFLICMAIFCLRKTEKSVLILIEIMLLFTM